MKRSALVLVMAGAVALMVSGPLQAQANNPWIHVQVDEAGDESSKVRVNLPLSVVQAALRLAPDKIVSHGHFHLPVKTVNAKQADSDRHSSPASQDGRAGEHLVAVAAVRR